LTVRALGDGATRALVLALVIAGGCTEWTAFSKDYEGAGVCPAYVVAADTHTCLRKTNGSLYCWGDNRFGQLGTGDKVMRSAPTRIDFGGLGVAKVLLPSGAGEISSDLTVFTCAITTDDNLYCWGDNRFGQLGTGDTTSTPKPALVKVLGPRVSKATNGSGHTCAQTTDSALFCWGKNTQGQLGLGTLGQETSPVQVPFDRPVERLSAGGDFSCARGTDGTLECWGDNRLGQLGTGDVVSQKKPVAVTTLGARVVRVSTGATHACAFTDDGVVWCWGDNRSGQLGTGDQDPRLTPVPIDPKGLGQVKANQIFAGGTHSCVLRDDSSLWCWGGNRFGQLGTGDTQPRLLPTQVAPDVLGHEVAAAYTGGAHTCAIKTNGALYCWGNNQYGQVGADVGSQTTTPVQVMGPCQ
jgi:alpha-tubulin suppressor-like RCC1 family protein